MGYSIMVLAVVLRLTLVFTATIDGVPDSTLDARGPKCEMDDGRIGVCVPNFQCDINKTVDRGAFIELRLQNCPHFLQVCCLQNEFVSPSKSPPISTPPPPMPSCGWSNPGAISLKEKGELPGDADYGEFPWMVALLRTSAPEVEWSQRDFLGGGSIIHPSVVITAAHKVDGLDENEVKCRAGEWNTLNTDELYDTQERLVQKIITHEDFFRIQAYYNVALLVLKTPFTLENHIGVACLGKRLPPPNTMCYTMGWGTEEEGNYAKILKKIPVPLVDSDKCQHSLRNTRLGSRFLLHPSLICAGGQEGVDSCKGDGGSPLVCNVGNPLSGNRYIIIGLVSSGIGCGKPNVPGVYVNVPYIYNWALEMMNEEKLDSKYFTY